MRDEEPHVELRSGSKGRPSEAGRQPVVEEKGAGEQTNISPRVDKYFSAGRQILQTEGTLSLQVKNVSLITIAMSFSLCYIS